MIQINELNIIYLDDKNKVAVSDITQKTAKVTVTNPVDSKKCFYKIFYAHFPTLGNDKICGDKTDGICGDTCATPAILTNLKPSTSYIIQVIVGDNETDANKNVVNTLFTTGK